MSFGFKYGVPLDADFVFDMRFLPNPFWVPELRNLTGLDSAVAEFVLGAARCDGVRRAGGLMEHRARGLPARGAPLCHGRRRLHRWQAPLGGDAERLAAELTGRGRVATFVVHRDLGRE
jgi:UPF0042 nucleotide-binding protein